MKTRNFGDVIRKKLKDDPKLAKAVAKERKRCTLLPIGVDNDGADFHDAIIRLLIRAKRTTRGMLEITVAGAAIDLIAAMDRYYNGEWTATEACKRINKALSRSE